MGSLETFFVATNHYSWCSPPIREKTCSALSSDESYQFSTQKCSKELLTFSATNWKQHCGFQRGWQKTTKKKDIQIRYDVSNHFCWGFLDIVSVLLVHNVTIRSSTSNPVALTLRYASTSGLLKTHRFNAELTWWLWRLKSNHRENIDIEFNLKTHACSIISEDSSNGHEWKVCGTKFKSINASMKSFSAKSRSILKSDLWNEGYQPCHIGWTQHQPMGRQHLMYAFELQLANLVR